ncbi:MAG: MoxR family ATPase [Defluviitaleaceae bacterium]|nr:MoxR family ATPase [Defluviitaleaceae bacterium]
MDQIQKLTDSIISEASKIIIGKEEQLRLVIMAVFCGGHVLLDDLPGVGKTTLVKAVSRVLGCSFSRVQFTPDLLPSDIIGMNIFDQKTGEFRMMHGPVMANILLADEINRAIPRTQSALLEAMEELQVTVDSITYPLPLPFLVLATQNPVEMESTFHLPVAQMDRFLVRLSLGYPTHSEEVLMLRTVGDDTPFHTLEPLLCPDDIKNAQLVIRDVHISDNVLEYMVSIVEATRNSDHLRLPVSPRGSRALFRAGKAWAAMAGRGFVTPDDIKALAPHILPHRVTLSTEARINGKTAQSVVADILETIPAPASKGEILRGK